MGFRPRFSLATLFLVVTAICVWLSWETGIIRERGRLIQMIVSRKGMVDNESGFGVGITYSGYVGDPDRMPKLWTLFGVKQIGTLWIPDGEFTAEEFQEFRRAFPELFSESNGYLLAGRCRGKKIALLHTCGCGNRCEPASKQQGERE